MPSESIDQIGAARTPFNDNDYFVVGQGTPPVPLFRGRMPDLANYVTAVQLRTSSSPLITFVGNVNYIMSVGDTELVTQVPFTTSPTWTLIAANAVPAGSRKRITDLAGSIGQFSLLVAPSGTNTINGVNQSLTISQKYANYEFESDGISNWTVVASGPRLLAINNLSDLTSVPTALGNLGLGTAAVHDYHDFVLKENNLSDLNSATSARANLGLGALAMLSTVFYNNLDPSMVATLSQLLSATLQKFISSDMYWAAKAPVTIPWAAAPVWDFNTFINGIYTITGTTTTVINVRNAKPGQSGFIVIKQPATSGAHPIGPGAGVAQWPPSFNFVSTVTAIGTAANAANLLEYWIEVGGASPVIRTRLTINI
jgi:hypothetical protein